MEEFPKGDLNPEDTSSVVEDFSLDEYPLESPLSTHKVSKIRIYNNQQLGSSHGFAIDFDSLVLFLTTQGHNQIDWSHGGQYCHLIWSVEKILTLFRERKSLFYFVLFEDHYPAILHEDPSKMLARTILLEHIKRHCKLHIFALSSFIDKSHLHSSFLAEDAPDCPNALSSSNDLKKNMQINARKPVNGSSDYGYKKWSGSWGQFLDYKSPAFVLLSLDRNDLIESCTSLSVTAALLQGIQVTARAMSMATLASGCLHDIVTQNTINLPRIPWSHAPLSQPLSTLDDLDFRTRVTIRALQKLTLGTCYNSEGDKETDLQHLYHFIQLYLIHLLTIEMMPLSTRCQVLVTSFEDQTLRFLQHQFTVHWTNLQYCMVDVIHELYNVSNSGDLDLDKRIEPSLIDIMDGRLFKVLFYLIISKPTSRAKSLIEHANLPDSASSRFDFLLQLVLSVSAEEDGLKYPKWPWFDVTPELQSLITDSMKTKRTESQTNFVPENYPICPPVDPENLLAEDVFPPCTSGIVDEIRKVYNVPQEYCYNIKQECEEVVVDDTSTDEVLDNWEDALSAEGDEGAFFENEIQRGPKTTHLDVQLIEDRERPSTFNSVLEDMELYWLICKRKKHPLNDSKKSKAMDVRKTKLSENRDHQNWCTWLSRYSASLNITGFKRGFPLIRPPKLPKTENTNSTIQASSKPAKKKSAKPGSKKAQQTNTKKGKLAKPSQIPIQALEEEEEEILQNLKEFCQDLNFAWNLLWQRFTIPKYIVAARIWVLSLLKEAWTLECRTTQTHEFHEDAHPIYIYRLIADTWFDYPEIIMSNPNYVASIIDCMQLLGYYEVAKQYELSMKIYMESNDKQSLDLCAQTYLPNWPDLKSSQMAQLLRRTHLPCSPTRFQLTYMGHLMDRNSNPQRDPRTPFYPDNWQKDLLDVIDASESALICAPTSSGKTFASFYLIQRVLTETTNGMVVYVCPTKALVNQGSSEVYRRFKDIILPDGQTLVGTCTREYRVHHDVCRILLTIPSCLELIMLSSTGKIRKNIEYVIFDEIHCLNEEENGVVWENLLAMTTSPFLALSATLGNMHYFRDWLQSLHSRKVNLINVEQRFSDIQISSWAMKIHDSAGESIQTNKASLDNCLTGKDSNLNKSMEILAIDTSKIINNSKIVPIHPISLLLDHYSHEDNLQQFQSLQSKITHIKTITLTSTESIQLYDQLFDISHREPLAGTSWAQRICKLDPELQFSSQICISQIQQRNWGKQLLKLFEELLTMDNAYPLPYHVCNRLCNYDSRQLTLKNPNDMVTEMVSLITALRDQKRLPAIVFNFSHSVCEQLALSLNKMLENDPLVREGEIYDDKGFEEIIDYIKARCTRVNEGLFSCLKNGIGVHHESLDRRLLSEVERLFRENHLKVVFSTKTLALGVNMPCRTVIFAGDSKYLTPVQYKQMSGRAGRRGYDYIGDAVFLDIPINKIQRLVLSEIPPLAGPFPITSSLSLRMMVLFTQAEPEERHHVQTGLVNLASKSLFAFRNPKLQSQIWYHFRFSLQYLWNEYMIDIKGSPIYLSGIVNNLSHIGSGNMVLHTFLLNPSLEELCVESSEYDFQEQMVNLLSRILTQPNSAQKLTNPLKTLEALHPRLSKVMELHTYRAISNYTLCIRRISGSFGTLETTLPLSEIQIATVDNKPEMSCLGDSIWEALADNSLEFKARSPFVATSGVNDRFQNASELCHTIRSDIPLSPEAVPIIFNEDMVGVDIAHSNHLVDFWKHGSRRLILREYNIIDNVLYDDVKVFCDTLLSIHKICQKAIPNSPLVAAFDELNKNLLEKFCEAYPTHPKYYRGPKELRLGNDPSEEILAKFKVFAKGDRRKDKEKQWLERD